MDNICPSRQQIDNHVHIKILNLGTDRLNINTNPNLNHNPKIPI